MFFTFVVLLALFVASSVCDEPFKRICYVPSNSGVLPEPYDLCTHLINSFASMSNGVLSDIPANPLATLRTLHPEVKSMLAVGGWGFNLTMMTDMIETEATRSVFIVNAIKTLRDNDYDGLDLDFEYPGANYPQYNVYSPPEDKELFTILVKELREGFEKESTKSGKNRLILSVAFGCRKQDIEAAYEIDKLAEHLDFMNLMTYDLRGAFDHVASHHSELYAGAYEIDDYMYNQDWAVKYFIEHGAPRNKLILGLAAYGKSFVWTTDVREMGAPANYSEYILYRTICKYAQEANWTRTWLTDQKVPILVNGDTMIGYDDVESIEAKVNYAIQNGLGGVMVWSLDADDYTGLECNQGKFPLFRKIYDMTKNTSVSQHERSSGPSFDSITHLEL